MKYALHILLCSICFLTLFVGCTGNPNQTDAGNDKLQSLEADQTTTVEAFPEQQMLYVPIYSDIYVDRENSALLLAATLSIRNTSLMNPLYIDLIDYYNTQGDLVRHYLENPIVLPPMASVNYVIEREDAAGGSGANFLLSIRKKTSTSTPLVQAVMVGDVGNTSFAFSTDGYIVNQ